MTETTMSDTSSEGGMAYPNQSLDTEKAMASISSLIKENQNLLPVLRREFRGEALQQYEDGSFSYVQVSKPYFVKINPITEAPLKQKVKYKDPQGVEYDKEIFIPNDEAIEELLSIFKSMGINQITILTNIDEDTILDDLREFECKLAALLCLKQKTWGIDKSMLPMLQMKIKTIIQDARYLACNGNTIKAIQKTVQRVEQSYEGEKRQSRNPFS